MDTVILDSLVKGGGVMGAVFLITVIPLAIYARSQARELKEVQEARAKDAQQIVDKLLGLNDRWNAIVGEQTRTVAAIDHTLVEVKHALNSVRDLLMQSK